MEAKVGNTDTSPDATSDNFSFGSGTQPAGDQPDAGTDAGASDNFTFGATEKGTPSKDANSSAPTASDEAKSPDNTDYASKGWLTDVLPATAKLAPKQFVETVQGIGHTLNPYNISETVGNFGKIGSGLASKAEGYLGVQQDPAEKAKTESLVNAIGQHYKDTYGGLLSGDTSGLKKELMTKGPIEPLMDAATVLTGGEGMLAKAPGMLGKAGALAGKLGSAIDPVQNALRVAGTVAKPLTWPIKKVAPYMQAGFTGVPKNLIDVATSAGSTTNPVLKDAFNETLTSGTAAAGQTNNVVRDALNGILKEQSSDYIAGKKALTANGQLQPLDWGNVTDALDAARKETRTTDPTTGTFMIKDKMADPMLDDLDAEIRGTPPTANSPGKLGLMNQPVGSVFNTLEGFDDLKQKIGNMTYGPSIPPSTKRILGGVYNGVKKSIVDVYPDYQPLMEQSQQNIYDAKDLMSQAGSDKIPATKQFAKVMLSTRKGDDTLLGALAAQDPTIPYRLAGHAMHDVLPSKLRTAIESPIALFAAMHNPAMLPLLAASSPRVNANISYGIGKLSKLPKKITPLKGNVLEQGSQLQNYPQAQANGGRIERKDGGSVIDPEKEAERLIGEVGRIRKQHSTKTRPLLNVPDEAITKALAVANAHI